MLERHEMEAFLAVASELHFGRAAEQIGVSPARVSQAIQKVERRIGAPLFERTSRRVGLTPLGAGLYAEVRPLYDGIQAALDRARDAAHGVGGTLRLGIMGALGHLILDTIDAFTDRHPECEVQIREIHFSDPFGALRAGEIDVAVVWLPVREPDLRVGPVVVREGNVLAVSSRHRLAGREAVSLEDIADERVIGVDRPEVPEYWEIAHAPRHTRSGRAIPRGDRATTFQEILAAVVTGPEVSFVSEHAKDFYVRPGITYIPISDAAPIRWGLVWRGAGELHRVRAFAEAAEAVSLAKGIPQE
ncbi:LysR family transcriptional regulator [Uniformispora flossi]|uniref:LysR family transcriptional regulator n=1 Tax=Uniformispora flossi TaxID=3390723 RepID=UPI003C3079D7